MSTETKKLDVLAVMDEVFEKPTVKASEVAYRKRDVYQARAAVAELIEAGEGVAKSYCFESPDICESFVKVDHEALRALFDALARVGGAA